MIDYNISEMTLSDVDGIENIEKSTFSTPWSRNGIEVELSNPNSVFFVAKSGENVVGYIGCHIAADEGYMANLAVLEDYRNMGIGKSLLLKLIDFCKDKNLAFLSLEVRQSNKSAIKLYESNNFILEGKRKNFYQKPTEDALIYTLRF
jgi:ribosomal-protein-alanine N-acetyltransferase